MWYFITITRAGQKFYVVSPAWGKYALSPTRDRNTYLWETQEDAEKDARWHHLKQDGDTVEYKRTYRS